jgi:uncharacterized membrane protein YfcA
MFTAMGDLIVFGVTCYLAYNAYQMVFRPEKWAARQRAREERKLAQSEARGKLVGGLVGGLAKSLLSGVLKNKPH